MPTGKKWLPRAVGASFVALLLLIGLPYDHPFTKSSQGMFPGWAPLASGGPSMDATLFGDGRGASGAWSASCDRYASDGYRDCQLSEEGGQTMRFLLHVPVSYDMHQKYPLVLVLHGGAERVRPEMTLAEGQAMLARTQYVRIWVSDTANRGVQGVQSRWPSFIVVPQLTYPNRWVDVPSAQGSHEIAPEPTAGLRLAKKIVDALQRKYPGVDAARIYVTGLSIGGYGTWDAIERWPGYFAAAVPVSGGGDPSKASHLKNMPIWIFHGADDPIVPVTGSRDMVEAIRSAGGQPRYTEYAGAGHDIFGNVYASDSALSSAGLFEWLFAQRRVGTTQ